MTYNPTYKTHCNVVGCRDINSGMATATISDDEIAELAGKPVSFRAPAELIDRIDAERRRELLSRGAFIRRAVLQSLALTAPEGL